MKLQEFHISSPFFSQNITTSFHINEILKNSINIFWYTLFFSVKKHPAHFLISWLLSEFIFIQKKILKIETLTRFIRLILVLKIEKISFCLTKLVEKTSQKHILLGNLPWLRISYIYSFLSINHMENDLKKQISTSNKKENKVDQHLWEPIYKILPYKMKNFKKFLFSLKNFHIGNLIEVSIENSKIPQKIEVKIEYLVLKIAGFNITLCLLIYLFSILKIKCPFSFVIEVLREKNQKLRNFIKCKSNRFIIIKTLIKSNLKRLKISRIAILENLIPLRLVNVNYLPRTLLEKKLHQKL